MRLQAGFFLLPSLFSFLGKMSAQPVPLSVTLRCSPQVPDRVEYTIDRATRILCGADPITALIVPAASSSSGHSETRRVRHAVGTKRRRDDMDDVEAALALRSEMVRSLLAATRGGVGGPQPLAAVFTEQEASVLAKHATSSGRLRVEGLDVFQHLQRRSREMREAALQSLALLFPVPSPPAAPLAVKTRPAK